MQSARRLHGLLLPCGQPPGPDRRPRCWWASGPSPKPRWPARPSESGTRWRGWVPSPVWMATPRWWSTPRSRSPTARSATAEGELVFWAGSIGVHALDVEFLRRVAGDSESLLPYHASPKKIPTVDSSGNRVNPSIPNGYKLERFVFDAFPAARSLVAIEARREEEYSPIKNATGNSVSGERASGSGRVLSTLAGCCRNRVARGWWSGAGARSWLDRWPRGCHGARHPPCHRSTAFDSRSPRSDGMSPARKRATKGAKKTTKKAARKAPAKKAPKAGAKKKATKASAKSAAARKTTAEGGEEDLPSETPRRARPQPSAPTTPSKPLQGEGAGKKRATSTTRKREVEARRKPRQSELPSPSRAPTRSPSSEPSGPASAAARSSTT